MPRFPPSLPPTASTPSPGAKRTRSFSASDIDVASPRPELDDGVTAIVGDILASPRLAASPSPAASPTPAPRTPAAAGGGTEIEARGRRRSVGAALDAMPQFVRVAFLAHETRKTTEAGEGKQVGHPCCS
jgi:hypothetical protein